MNDSNYVDILTAGAPLQLVPKAHSMPFETLLTPSSSFKKNRHRPTALSAFEVAKAKRMHCNGFSLRIIGSVLHVSKNTVARALSNSGTYKSNMLSETD